jgi:hypothetical protein
MKDLLTIIEKKNQEFAQLPFFEYMKDESVEPQQKLAFAPVVPSLALGFSELCKRVLRQEPTTNKIQEMVNKHTYEEHFHWQWLLEDIEKMGINYSMPFSDAVRFMWSEHTKISRSLLPLFERYTYQADPIIKLVAVEVAEVTANIFFRATNPVAMQLQAMTGHELRYFGMCHYHVENTHTLHTPASLQAIRDIEVPEKIRQQAMELIDVAFDYFTELVNEFLVYIKNYSSENPFGKSALSKQSLSAV